MLQFFLHVLILLLLLTAKVTDCEIFEEIVENVINLSGLAYLSSSLGLYAAYRAMA